jgi:hypothetical protein
MKVMLTLMHTFSKRDRDRQEKFSGSYFFVNRLSHHFHGASRYVYGVIW